MNNTRNRTSLLRIALNHSLRFLPAILFVLLTKSQGMARPDSPLVRLAIIEINTSYLHQYKKLLIEEIDASIAKETDVITLYAVAETNSKQDPTNVSIVEVYSNRIAHEKHLTTSHYLKYPGRSNDMIKTVEFIDARPILLGSNMSD